MAKTDIEKDVEKKAADAKKVPKGMIVADGGVYFCKKKCFFGIQIYKVDGKSLKFKKGKLIPHHFTKEEPQVEEDVII